MTAVPATYNRAAGDPPSSEQEGIAALAHSLSVYAERQKGVRGGARRRSFPDFLKCIKDTHSWDNALRHKAQERLNDVYETGYAVTKAPDGEVMKSVDREVTKAAMSENSGTLGGYLVPVDYTTKLLETIGEEDFILPRANVIPFVGREARCPRIDVETLQSAGTTPFFGGMKFVWGSENVPSETDPTFRDLGLTAWDLLGFCRVSNQQLSDSSPLFEEKLIKAFGKAAAWYAEFAFLQGSGAAKLMPLGIIGPGGTGNVVAPGASLITRTTTSTVTAADLTAMTAALLPFSWSNAVWACHPNLLTPLQQLPQYFFNIELGGLHKTAKQAAGVLFTKPLFVTEKLPAPGSNISGDIILFDPWLYVIGMRQEVVIDYSSESRFQTNESEYRIWMRLDGKPQVSNTITLQDGVTKVSPYVVLKGK